MSDETHEAALNRFGASRGDKHQKLKIAPQITEPMVHKSTKKRTFGCLRDECRGLAMEDLTNRKWKMMYKNAKTPGNGTRFRDNLNVRLTWLESDTTELTKLKKEKPDLFDVAYKQQVGRTYLSVLDGADAIGGNKGQQLRGKQGFVRRRSKKECTYNDLSLQPAQYRLYMKEECEAFLRNEGNGKSFLLKPETGSQGKGITFHAGVDSVKKKAKRFFPCEQNPSMSALERVLVQEYIEKPLLLERSKFDLRVYMLIASSEPWMVFYHEGYLRRSLFEYSASSKNRAVYLTNTHYQSMRENFKLSEHIWTFERLQSYLTTQGRAGAHYVDSVLEPYIKRAANFVFQSARAKLQRRKGSFHIFGLDFMIDDRFQVHFIEANGYPGYTWSINFDTRGFVAEQFNLVMELHEAPTAFEKMRAGDRYGAYELIFSELEEAESGAAYDPCFEFFNNERSFKVLRGAMGRFSKYTGFAALKALRGQDDPSCNSKSCKAKRKQARKQATKQRNDAERHFQGFLDDVQGAELLGGLKTDQITTLASYARRSGCSLNKMFVVPATYRMFLDDECRNAQKYRTPSKWVAKPLDGARGAGFEFFGHQDELEGRFLGCSKGVAKGKLTAKDSVLDFQKAVFEVPQALQFVVQKQITNRLLVSERTWDLRAYMLIACTEPFMVFYHDGYARSTEEDTTELTFDDFQMLLSQQGKAGDSFMSSAFETYAKQVMRLLFHAGQPMLRRRKKSYQLLELTFVLDDTYTFWYLAANNSPQLSRAPKVVKQVINPMQDELKSLVLETSDVPEALTGMRFGDRYGDWRLVYSEYEDFVRNATYNPCRAFGTKWSLSKPAVLKTARIHDYKTRVESANLRELKKYTRAAWDRCRVKGKIETCYNSESVRKAVRARWDIFVGKATVNLSSAQIGDDNDDEDDDKESLSSKQQQEAEAYVESRMRDMAGMGNGEEEDKGLKVTG